MRPVSSFDLETVLCRGDFGQRRAGFELVQDFGRLGVETGRDFLLAPARLDLILHLLERALARWRYADDVVPDVAVLHLQRVALDADVGAERPGQQPLRIGKVHGRARRVAAGAVDRLDRARRQLEICGGLGQRLAFGARILDLVVDVEDLGLGARSRQLLLELAGHLLEGADLLGLDLEHLHQHGAEPALAPAR